MAEKVIFQIHSTSVISEYKKANYRIEYADGDSKFESDLCAIYFSSHDIYYPNTYDAFHLSIVQNDKYEWRNSKVSNAQKHIFVRDIHKQWYLTGINETINNPQKLYEFLKTETEGFRIICLGSSAGGYAALLYGNLLNCERVFSFNPQLDLRIIKESSNPFKDPVLFENFNDIGFFEISKFLNSITANYYFQSCNSTIDLAQFESVNRDTKKKLRIIRFKTSNHGFPFLRINVKHILSLSTDELDKLVGEFFHPFAFSVKLIGLISTLKFLLMALGGRFKKKLLEFKFSKVT
ncbi:MAG: hypothetical protein KA527_04725 [Cytophagaceae bacterium]|nr:hypothetical protein [Cytophagaceae bacterium]